MRIFALLTLMFFSSQVFASADSLSTKKHSKAEHQIFLNTTFFLKQIISLSNQNIAISPYILGYKCFFHKSHGIRMSVGGSFSNKKEFPDSISTRITGNVEIDYRLGYEFRHTFGKRWTVFTGADAVGNQTYNRVKANTVFDIVSTQTNSNSIGGGPFVGIQFSIGKHVSLFTETAFYYSYTWSKRIVRSQNFPASNENRNSGTESKGEFILPTSLYFVFIF